MTQQQEQILPRQEKIIELVSTEGSIAIVDLAQRLGVTEQTIRRDIRKLEELSLVARYHGGVSKPLHGLPHLTNKALSERELIYVEQKEAIAAAAASLIEEGSTIFITIGSTVEKIAEALRHKKNIRVITDSIRVAARLYENKDIEVLLPSGTIRSANGGIEGPKTIADLSEFRADYVITSIGAVEEDGSLLDFNLTEVMAARCMIKNSRRFILACDHSKFSAAASVRLGHISSADVLITDAPPPQSVQELLLKHDVSLLVTGSRSEPVGS